MNISRFISRQFEGILQLFYPPVCVACQKTIREDHDIKIICLECLNSCQTVSPDFIQTQILNRLQPCFLDNLIVNFQFDKVLQIIIHNIKYQKMNRLAFQAATFAQKYLPEELLHGKGDIVIPVPLHALREKERGFNQSLYIAKGFFHEEDIPLQENLLIRNRYTESQTALNREEREKNISDAFTVREPRMISGNSIIIVDDVVTTGATLNECSRVLKSAGAAKVVGLALATPVD